MEAHPAHGRDPIGRIPIVDVQPVVEHGRRSAKAVVGETFEVTATLFGEGRDVLGAEVVLRDQSGRPGRAPRCVNSSRAPTAGAPRSHRNPWATGPLWSRPGAIPWPPGATPPRSRSPPGSTPVWSWRRASRCTSGPRTRYRTR